MARLFMQAYSLFQPCQTDAQISFLQNCLMSTAAGEGIISVLLYSQSQSLAIGPTLGFKVAVSYSKRPNSMPSLPQ